jgi:hypothetical protein
MYFIETISGDFRGRRQIFRSISAEARDDAGEKRREPLGCLYDPLDNTDLGFHTSLDFDFVGKDVRRHTAVPLDADELTAEVIDETLNGSLGESADQASVSSDKFRRVTPHAFLDSIDH